MHVEGQDRVFRGSIGPFSADNLGAHSLGGFMESFSSLRICRFCMATRGDIQTKVHTCSIKMHIYGNHYQHDLCCDTCVLLMVMKFIKVQLTEEQYQKSTLYVQYT